MYHQQQQSDGLQGEEGFSPFQKACFSPFKVNCPTTHHLDIAFQLKREKTQSSFFGQDVPPAIFIHAAVRNHSEVIGKIKANEDIHSTVKVNIDS